MTLSLPLIIGGVIVGLLTLALFSFVMWAINLRTATKPDEVHVVLSAKGRRDYGHMATNGGVNPNGNVYYNWPEWVPILGVSTSIFKSSIFPVELKAYEGYDSGRIPFEVDVMAFFRVEDALMASRRVSNFPDLIEQLRNVVRGAVRSVLAKDTLENIMQDRSSLGEKFTAEIQEGLKQWGVVLTRQIEFMDIRDAQGSMVIKNIMAKEQSRIDMESRTIVAHNKREAQEREIEAERQVDLAKQEALQQVGTRTAEVEKQVGIASELSQQEILASARTTAERTMEVKRVEETLAAEIAKTVAETQAAQQREVTIIQAEGEKRRVEITAEATKQQNVITADGDLQAALKDAEAIKAKGEANASAEYLILQAPIKTQLELATGLGQNREYLEYLNRQRSIEASEKVGMQMADAIGKADLKVISNSGDIQGGVNGIMDMFSAKGGTHLAAMAEAFAQSDIGKAVIEKAIAPATTEEPKTTRSTRSPKS